MAEFPGQAGNDVRVRGVNVEIGPPGAREASIKEGENEFFDKLGGCRWPVSQCNFLENGGALGTVSRKGGGKGGANQGKGRGGVGVSNVKVAVEGRGDGRAGPGRKPAGTGARRFPSADGRSPVI